MARIFHIATEADWRAARSAGHYTTSTRGRTLAEEGFIHASRGDQWQEVRRDHYADVDEPLLLLVIDTDLLDVPVIEEAPAGTTETFPHVYGPLDVAAVVQAVPVAVAEQGGESFRSVFFREMFANAVLGIALMAFVAGGVLLGRAVDPVWGLWVGLVAGLLAGVGLVVQVNRRRRRA